MTRSGITLALLIVVLAPTVAAAQEAPGDEHVRLRIQAGVPAASAAGNVRIFSEGYLTGAGATSLVARRSGGGRWTVSQVRVGGYLPQGRLVEGWRLKSGPAAQLEKILDDPLAFVDEPPPPEAAACLDPPSARLDVRWRGRSERLYQDCGPWGVIERIGKILMEGRP